MADEQQQDQSQFEVTTTAQVERTYRVTAADKDTAHKRLRRYLEDPEMVRPDLVSLIENKTTDATPQKVKVDSIKALPGEMRVVTGAEKKAV